ncbi:MAG: response regulator transcription factor [Candidatus Eremiobacteraeota bacterium]|nr:response regulator transcription factor [Candidatus Eremiobacteraeota bacterium]
MHVLLIEDEPRVHAFIKKGLEENGFLVEVAEDGESGLDWAMQSNFDLIVLDVMLPRIDGIELCQRLRKAGVTSRVLMLTARDGVDDRVLGLEAGADDYLVKPFAFRELLARLRALTRRNDSPETNLVKVGDLELDILTRRLKVRGKEASLSAKEFDLLHFFMRNPDRVLSRTVLAEHVWGFDYDHRSNVVEVYVRYLRQKIDNPPAASLIETVRGVGYRLVASDASHD